MPDFSGIHHGNLYLPTMPRKRWQPWHSWQPYILAHNCWTSGYKTKISAVDMSPDPRQSMSRIKNDLPHTCGGRELINLPAFAGIHSSRLVESYQADTGMIDQPVGPPDQANWPTNTRMAA
ncbi:hypothetical protein H4S14_001218 [Agrobacterium vitis]|nr:hypothetical protein [Agrobacterium vitis]MBE1437487.1 hypothetical protein [Agrobacterium vitis]